MKAKNENGKILIGVPRRYKRPNGIDDHAYNTRSDEIHFSDGWKLYIVPIEGVDYDPALEKLGKLIERGLDFTFEIVPLSDEEIKQNIINEVESSREVKLQMAIKQQMETQFQLVENDIDALNNQDVYPLWTSFDDGYTFDVGFKIQHFEGIELKLYKVLQSHNKQFDWEPSISTSLFKKILREGVPLVWESGIWVTVGQEYEYNSATYIVVQSHTTQLGWEPINLPSLWQLKVV